MTLDDCFIGNFVIQTHFYSYVSNFDENKSSVNFQIVTWSIFSIISHSFFLMNLIILIWNESLFVNSCPFYSSVIDWALSFISHHFKWLSQSSKGVCRTHVRTQVKLKFGISLCLVSIRCLSFANRGNQPYYCHYGIASRHRRRPLDQKRTLFECKSV